MDSGNVTRSQMLARLGMAPIAIGAFAAMIAESDAATKMGTSPKAALKYQDKPMGAAECDNCASFINPKKKGAKGGCTIVAGPISPKGWCQAYNKGSNAKNTM